MSATETETFQDIESSILIPIMYSATFATSPKSLIQVGPTFWTAVGDSSAARARLRGKSFIHLLKPSPVRNRFVAEHVSEGRPASIKNRLRHAGFGESGRVHVAHGDVIKLSDDARGELMVEIAPRIGNAGVNIGSLALLSGALRNCEPFLKFVEMARVGDLLARGHGGEVLQSEINTDALYGLAAISLCNLNDDVEKPIAATVSGKVRAVLDLAFRQGAAVEHAEGITGKAEGITFALQVATPNWNPSKGLFATITKVRLFVLASRLCIPQANLSNCVCIQTKFFAAPCGQVAKVKSSQPFSVPSQSILLSVIAIVPDKVDRTRLLIQQAVQRLHAVTIDKDHFSNHYEMDKAFFLIAILPLLLKA